MNMHSDVESAGQPVCINVTKGKSFALDRTPWYKNTNSLYMNNAQRFLKRLHTSIQLLNISLVTQDCLLTWKQYINPLHSVRLFTVLTTFFDTGVLFLHATADIHEPTLSGRSSMSLSSHLHARTLEQNLRPIT